MKRLLAPLALCAVAGCSGMLNFEAPPERTTIGAERRDPAPVERPMQLTPESYRVAKGDTLFSIAFRNNLDFRDVARWNGIGSDYRIVPGQVLQLTPQPGTEAANAGKVVVPQPATPPKPSPAAPKPPLRAATAPPVTPAGPVAKAPAVAEEPVAAAPAEYPSGFSWQWPTAGSILRKYSPAEGVKGIDFTGNLGQPVFASAPGRVVYSGNALKGYGELIIIKHDEVHLSAYGYNRKRYVVEGDVVTTGQPIGELGMGPESKPILHFEIRERGKPVNPATYLPPRPSNG